MCPFFLSVSLILFFTSPFYPFSHSLSLAPFHHLAVFFLVSFPRHLSIPALLSGHLDLTLCISLYLSPLSIPPSALCSSPTGPPYKAALSEFESMSHGDLGDLTYLSSMKVRRHSEANVPPPQLGDAKLSASRLSPTQRRQPSSLGPSSRWFLDALIFSVSSLMPCH